MRLWVSCTLLLWRLRRAHVCKVWLFWCTGAILTRCPSWHHWRLMPVTVGLEPTLAGLKSSALTTEPRLLHGIKMLDNHSYSEWIALSNTLLLVGTGCVMKLSFTQHIVPLSKCSTVYIFWQKILSQFSYLTASAYNTWQQNRPQCWCYKLN